MEIELRINGSAQTLDVPPQVSLLDALREYLGLSGTRKGCDQGGGGACTVLADGQRINACLALAAQYEAREITTIEEGRPPDAGGVRSHRRVSVRLPHAGPDLFGDRYVGRAQGRRTQRGDRAPRRHERASLDTPEHVRMAEQLGFGRAWLHDTAQQSPDVWVCLAPAAERTTSIGLGPGVLVPTLRHPMVNASATVALELLAPGRVAVGFGTGYTGRLAERQAKPISWSTWRGTSRRSARCCAERRSIETAVACACCIQPVSARPHQTRSRCTST